MDMNEPVKPIQTKAKKPRGNWKDSRLIFLFLPVLLTLLFPLGGLPYLCGRFIPYTGTLVHVCMLYPLVCIFIIYCLYRGISKRFRGLREVNTKSKLEITAEIALPLIFLISLLVFFFTSVKGMLVFDRPFMYGLQTRTKNKTDVEAVRDWLKSLDKEEYDSIDNGYNSYPHNRSEWPKPLRALKPNKIFLSVDKNGNAKVRLVWGSSPIEGHWGIEIGTENMKIPPSDFSMYGEYRLPVEPGVYVWRGLE